MRRAKRKWRMNDRACLQLGGLVFLRIFCVSFPPSLPEEGRHPSSSSLSSFSLFSFDPSVSSGLSSVVFPASSFYLSSSPPVVSVRRRGLLFFFFPSPSYSSSVPPSGDLRAELSIHSSSLSLSLAFSLFLLVLLPQILSLPSPSSLSPSSSLRRPLFPVSEFCALKSKKEDERIFSRNKKKTPIIQLLYCLPSFFPS